MTLEDFEKSLSERQKEDEDVPQPSKRKRPGIDSDGQHHHHHRHGRSKRHRDDEERGNRHRHSRHSDRGHHDDSEKTTSKTRARSIDRQKAAKDLESEANGKHPLATSSTQASAQGHSDEGFKRDSWMEAPSAVEVDYIQRRPKKSSQPSTTRPSKADFDLKIHEKELNRYHLQDLAEGQEIPAELIEKAAQHDVEYTFGDRGSQWRMAKLKNVFRQAEETGKPVDAVAEDVYGDIRSFDDAREEQTELERRDTYGPGYIGKEQPSGELFQERKMEMGVRRNSEATIDEPAKESRAPVEYSEHLATTTTTPLDHTALNRLKAQMMKAKLRGSADASRLEAEYEAALKSSADVAQPNSVVLGAMDSRMLAGSRKGEVKTLDNKRGRERGLVEENEDMSIEDMVREERRTRYEAGGESRRFAERIVKDGKFDVSLCELSLERADQSLERSGLHGRKRSKAS